MSKLDLPRYLKWRAGRPRWELGGKGGAQLVAAGFTSRDLKDAHGGWMGLEAAIREAARLNHEVDGWRRGDLSMDARLAPSPVSIAAGGRLTVAGLIAAYEASEAFNTTLGDNARRANKSSGRALACWVGDIAPASVTPSTAQAVFGRILDYGQWRRERKLAGMPFAEPEAFRALGKGLMDEARQRRFRAMEASEGQPPGYARAFLVCAYARNLWNWSRTGLDYKGQNPFEKMRLASPEGRVREIEPHELAHLVDTAEAMGLPMVGDALILGVHTVQRRGDLCRLGWEVRETGRVRLVQQKTSASVDFRISAILKARLDVIWERQRRQKLDRMDAILVTPRGVPFAQVDDLSDLVAKVRTKAAETMPSCADILLHDTRDTGVTRLFRSGLDAMRVCQISGHSLKQLDIIRKSYLKTNPELSDQATDAADGWAAKHGLRY